MTERVLLLGKPGCHLCDDARAVVAQVCADAGVQWSERDVNASATDMTSYGEMIPVVFVDGVVHGYWRIDAGRLSAALA
ncbi:MAG: hypothetical protein QOF57_91 [Frankiaceae bacterium]|jgi:hypothetical protein|nr:hypothetical protein [Frankiaceae bacterium]